MQRLLEHLGTVNHDGVTMGACAECGYVLAPLSSGYKAHAARFDEPISAGEPAHHANDAAAFVLRHYCCPRCATLFEIDMVERSTPEIASIALHESATR